MSTRCSAVTASEDKRPPSSPPTVERALELFVYLPAGALSTALRSGPAAVAAQGARLHQQLENARFVGRFAVDLSWRQLRGRFGDSIRTIERMVLDRTERLEQGDPPEPHPVTRGAPLPSLDPADAGTSAPPANEIVVDAVIADYDTLAASQVVRRLDGLAAPELRAVARHEAAARHRRTVLHRIDQLLAEPSLPTER